MTEKEYDLNTYDSIVGKLTMASDGTSLVGLWMEGQKYFGNCPKPTGHVWENTFLCRHSDDVFRLVRQWLDDYFSGKKPDIADLPLNPGGSEFRQRVWKTLCGIPYGKTMTYGEIAAKLARETGQSNVSARAVGGAVGHNPIAILIPCHRVVGESGHLTGYAGGLENKIRLLQLEGTELPGSW